MPDVTSIGKTWLQEAVLILPTFLFHFCLADIHPTLLFLT